METQMALDSSSFFHDKLCQINFMEWQCNILMDSFSSAKLVSLVVWYFRFLFVLQMHSQCEEKSLVGYIVNFCEIWKAFFFVNAYHKQNYEFAL